MTTEQTGRVSIETTDSIELLVSPAGGDPTPLPEARAADGTKRLKAAPPRIPSRASSPPPVRAASQTIPPPIPSRTSAQMPAVARTQTPSKMPPLPAHARAKGTVPPVRASSADPDGWVVPSDLPPRAENDSLAKEIDALAPKAEPDSLAAQIDALAPGSVEPQAPVSAKEAAGEDLRDIMDEDPEGPDATTATPFAEPAAVDPGPSKEWLAKIDSVLRPETSAPVAFTKPDTQAPLFTTKAAATMFAAEPPQNTQPLELVDLEAVEPPKVTLPAPVAAKPVQAKPLPQLPKATLPPPAQVISPAPSLAISPQAAVKPLTARRAPIATPSGYPIVSELDGPTDQDAGSFDIDIDSDRDMTSALTTGFDLPVKHRFISQRMAIAIFAGAAVLTVAYLGTRGGSQKKPTHTETAPAETAPVAAPTPAPVAAPAQPQQVAAAVPAPVEQPAAPAQPNLVQIPVTSTPSGALVSFVDGGHAVVIGRTPTTVMVDPKTAHDIALTLLDHETKLATIPAGGVTSVAIDMGPEKAGAMKTAPQQVAAAAPREETTAMVAPKAAVKHEAPKHETPAHAPKTQHITQPAPRAEAPAIRGDLGTLMISAKPPCEIVVDGKNTHLMTPQKAIPLAAGMHTVMLVNAQMNVHKSVTVMIAPKKPTKLIQDFTKR